jgi:DNA modification methylase
MTVRLAWPTRDDRPIESRGARIVSDRRKREPGASRLVAGDNLRALCALVEEGLGGKIDLVYLDPPYMSGVDYAVESASSRSHAYGDRWSHTDQYLDMLYPRLRMLHALLAPHGSIWVQVDHRAAFLVHALLDEIFGSARFRNTIVWRRAPPLGRQVRSGQFPRNVDTLVVYAKGDRPRFHPLSVKVPLPRGKARFDEEEKRWFTLAPRGDYTDQSIARLEKENRVHRTGTGKVYIKYFVEQGADGSLTKARAVDSMWDDIAPLRHVPPAERTGYPTQKPEALLERVVLATSDPGDLVLDPFAGSATTAIVAARHGRRFIAIDESPVALETARARLKKAGAKFEDERVEGAIVPAPKARGASRAGKTEAEQIPLRDRRGRSL